MSKALFESLGTDPATSFHVRYFELERFTVPYHHHPEYELTLILQGSGKRFVGKNMADFEEGDLVFLGSDLPHCWKSDMKNPHQNLAKSIVIQFQEHFLGPEFFGRPELSAIRNLMKISGGGIQFSKSVTSQVRPLLIGLTEEPNAFLRLTQFLSILNTLAQETAFTLLDPDSTHIARDEGGKERMHKVMGYIVDNFQNDIQLDQIANRIGMSTNAFCKYFKRTTRKTFMETVIEYRINYAAQQLLNTDKAVSEVAFESGFGDVSHFHKLFKRMIKMSPLVYRHHFQKSL